MIKARMMAGEGGGGGRECGFSQARSHQSMAVLAGIAPSFPMVWSKAAALLGMLKTGSE